MEVNVNLHLSVKPCEPQQQTFALFTFTLKFLWVFLSLSQSFTLYHLLDWDSSSKVFLQNHRLFIKTVTYSITIDYRNAETMIFKLKYGQRKADSTSWEWVVTFEYVWHDFLFPWKHRLLWLVVWYLKTCIACFMLHLWEVCVTIQQIKNCSLNIQI